MANINKIKLSGTTYNIQDLSAAKSVELTQAQYDALVSGGTVDPNTFYIITDAQGADLSQYYTSAQTESAITAAVSGKVDTSTFNTYSGSVDTALSGKQETLVSGTNIKTINNESILGSGNITIQGGGGGGTSYSAGTGIDITNDVISVTGMVDTSTFNTYSGSVETALSGKQDTLSAGTGIEISGNVISATGGGGGGKAISAGTNISITTGETADTINCTLPISAGTGTNSIKCGGAYKASGNASFAGGSYSEAKGIFSMAFGRYSITNNYGEVALGFFNNSNGSSSAAGNSSGNTLFSVGNGTNSASITRHNAFEIRQNGDIYITSGGTDIKLQDNLGGGGGTSYSAGTGIDITNDVISVTGMVDTTTFNTYSGSVDTAINSKASQSDLSTLSGTVTAHTANTDIHVTTAQTAAWDAKSDFSGSYNDLTDKPTIPTVPTSNTAFTNDAGYITSDAISGKADTSAVTESINAAVSGKADTSDVFITSSNRNSIVSNIHEEVYQLSTDDIYSITATKASSGDIIYCQIMVDNMLYSMQGSSTSITYSDAALSGLVTADFSTSMSITLNDRENHHINEIFIEAYNTNNNSYIKEITIVHNPPIGANKIDYVSSIYTEFVHEQYAMKTDLNRKQDTLVSGTNIKTINNESILGSGNITIQGGGSVDQTVISGSTNAVAGGAVYTQLDGLKLKKITQSAYDALSPNYDANTLYVING